MEIPVNWNSLLRLWLTYIKKIIILSFASITTCILKTKNSIINNEILKINIIYLSVSFSIILFLVFVQFFNVNNVIKIIVGFTVLLGNLWVLKKNNL